jgi:hypothetical protein
LLISELQFDLGDGFIEGGFSLWRFLVLGERQGRKESQVYDYKNPPDFTHAGDLLIVYLSVFNRLSTYYLASLGREVKRKTDTGF